MNTNLLALRSALPIVTAVALMSGCGSGAEVPTVASVGTGSPSPAITDRAVRIERYRDCLLREGVTLLDHPTAEGMPQVDKARADPDVVGAAYEKCRPLLPSGGDAGRPAPEAIEAQRRLAACIRDHGVPDYPDPDPVTGDPRIDGQLGVRLKQDPNMASALLACQGQPSPGASRGTIGG